MAKLRRSSAAGRVLRYFSVRHVIKTTYPKETCTYLCKATELADGLFFSGEMKSGASDNKSINYFQGYTSLLWHRRIMRHPAKGPFVLTD